MTAIHIPRRHSALPSGRLLASPEYEGRLALLAPFFGDSAGRCLVTGVTPTYPAQPLAYSYGPTGLTLNVASWATTAMTIPVSVAGSPVTLVLSGKNISGVVAWMLHGAGNWTATYGTSFQNVTSSNAVDFSGELALTDNGLPIDPGNQVLAATMGGANDLRAVVNGGQVLADTSCTAVSGTMHTLRFGADHANANKSDVTVRFAAVLRGTVPSEELWALSDCPGRLFRADPIRIYSLPSGGYSQDLAAAGTAAATGTATPAAQVALAGVGVSLAAGIATASGSAPLTATGAATASGTAAPTVQIALSAIGLAVSSGAAALSGAAAGELAAGGQATAQGSASLAANVTIAASGLAQAAASAGLSASVLLAGAGAAQAAGNATLAAELHLLAAGAAQASGSATVTGYTGGQLAAGGQAQALGTAALVLDVRLQAAGTATASGSATLDSGSTQAIAASGGAQAAGTGQVSAQVVLTGAGFVQAMGAGSLRIEIELAALGAGTAAGSAALSVLLDIDAMAMPTLVPAARVCRIPHRSRVLTIG